MSEWVKKALSRCGVERKHVEGSFGRMLAALPELCDWNNPDFDTPGSHADYHYGSPCPYESVVPAYLQGLPDPRRDIFQDRDGSRHPGGR